MSRHHQHYRATTILPHHRFQGSLGAPLIHIKGTIVTIFPGPEHHHGANHQHFTVKIDEVVTLDGGNVAPDSLVGATVFLAVRFGDNIGLDSEIPDLTVGAPIEIQGEFVDSADAYKTQDNAGDPPLAVIHFTHHPVGYVIYNGQHYS
jgi:hypothetical protein